MATTKKECMHRFKVFPNRGFYSPHGKHSALGNVSPAEFEPRPEQRQLQAAAS